MADNKTIKFLRTTVFMKDLLKKGAAIFFIALSFKCVGQTISDGSINSLWEQFVQSEGYRHPIRFDASNIKQYWADTSVRSQNETMIIKLFKTKDKKYESVPLKIQFKNVNASMDCKIDVITKETGINFSVYNPTTNKELAKNGPENKFLEFTTLSSIIHFEDIDSSSLCLRFQSPGSSEITIEMIVVSFTLANDYLRSPGTLTFNNMNSTNNSVKPNDNTDLISLTGTTTTVQSNKKILVSNNNLSAKVKIKNTGKNAVNIYFGYITYTQNGVKLNSRNYPYKNINAVLNVVSYDKENNTIIVDQEPVWGKNCYVAMNAKEDMSDVPNVSLLSGRIDDVKKMENQYSAISFKSKLKDEIKEGDKIRIHGASSSNLYVESKTVQPEEEVVINATIQKDDDYLQFAKKAFSKDVFYVVPFVRVKSLNQDSEHTVTIDEFVVSY